ncbi:aspartate kinase [Candidatus Roizmanbacteria bacterium]|nr:aspartate kinase [Candidatus Roizmanbacteria bacterium]
MLTISQAVREKVEKSPILSEAMDQGVLNYSALARKLRQELEKELYKPVSAGSIVMALKRLSKQLRAKIKTEKVFSKSPDILIRSNLIEITVLNANFTDDKFNALFKKFHQQKKYFFTLTQGVFETTIIASNELSTNLNRIIKGEQIVSRFDNLSAITIRLSKEVIPTPGVYYSLLKFLAWEEINIIEVVSTFLEFTIILENKDVDKAFSVLKRDLS